MMSIFSMIKCVLTLGKCSKWLYYIKKVLCVSAVLFVCVSVGFFLLGENKMSKKLLRQFKAVL